MGGYQRIITDEKGRKFLQDPATLSTYQIGNEMTPEGEKIADKIVDEVVSALFRFSKGERRKHGS